MKRQPETARFLKKLDDFLSYVIPRYVKEGKSYLTIGIGCTGGRHRSVMIANAIAEPPSRQGLSGARAPSRPAAGVSAMIGIVVVTHGQLAEELVNAARTIVGDIPAIAAVSIGWTRRHDRDARERHRARARRRWAGTTSSSSPTCSGARPTNVSLPFLSPQVEIVTGVNLPMLIKLTTLREGDLMEVARVVRDQGKGAIYVASEILEKKPS